MKGDAFYPFLGGELRAKTVDAKHNLVSRWEVRKQTDTHEALIHNHVQEDEYTTDKYIECTHKISNVQ